MMKSPRCVVCPATYFLWFDTKRGLENKELREVSNCRKLLPKPPALWHEDVILAFVFVVLALSVWLVLTG